MRALQRYLQLGMYFLCTPLFANVVQPEYIEKIKLYSAHPCLVSELDGNHMREDLYTCLILLQKVYTSEDKDYPSYKAYEFLLRVIFHLYDQLSPHFDNNDLFILLQQRVAALKKMCMSDKNIFTLLKTKLYAARFVPIPISPGAFGSGLIDVFKVTIVIVTILCAYKFLKHVFLSERQKEIDKIKNTLSETNKGFGYLEKSLEEGFFVKIFKKDELESKIKKLTEAQERVEKETTKLNSAITQLKSSMKAELAKLLDDFEKNNKEKSSDKLFSSVIAEKLTEIAQIQVLWREVEREQKSIFQKHNALLGIYKDQINLFMDAEAMEIGEKGEFFRKINEDLQGAHEKLTLIRKNKKLINACNDLLENIGILKDYFNKGIYKVLTDIVPKQEMLINPIVPYIIEEHVTGEHTKEKVKEGVEE